MKIYETKKGVDEYFKMAEGYDLSKYKSLMLKHLPKGKSLLEIGMGPGNDFAWLSRLYDVTGSDYSKEFVDRARKRFPQSDIKILDGISLKIDETFDALFSCKVYQHIQTGELETVLKNQYKILNEDGLIIHSFWVGSSEMEIEDMHFYYHDLNALKELISNHFVILESESYTEFEEDDSLFLIARKK